MKQQSVGRSIRSDRDDGDEGRDEGKDEADEPNNKMKDLIAKDN